MIHLGQFNDKLYLEVKCVFCRGIRALYVLTVCLPPAEVISKVTVARIQDHASIKARGKQEGLIPKKLPPVKHIGGGELGGHMGHELTARGESGREEVRQNSTICEKA